MNTNITTKIGLIIWWARKNGWLELERDFYDLSKNKLHMLLYLLPSGGRVEFYFNQRGMVESVNKMEL